MAHQILDFRKETTTTTGTGNITLLGARSPGNAFSSGISNGDTFDYAISHTTLNQWEVGVGTMLTSTTFSRSVVASSNANALVNFSAGIKNVDVVDPAQRILRRVGPVVIGATSLGSGSLSFSNANGVSWGLATGAGGGTITASVNAGVFDALLVTGANGSSVSATGLAFSNVNGMTLGVSTQLGFATVTGSYTVPAVINSGLLFATGNGTSQNISRVDLSAANGFTWLMATAASALTLSASYRAIRSFSAANLGISSMTTLGETEATAAQQLIFQQHSTSLNTSLSYINVGMRLATGGTTARVGLAAWNRYFASNQTDGITAQQLSFSDANGVTFGIATTSIANSGVIPIVTASVAAGGGGGITAFNLTNAASSVAATILNFSNANGFSFLLSTGASVGTLSASYTVPTHTLAVSASGNSISNGTFVLSNSNNVSFGMAGSTITASATVASTQASINLSAGTTSNLASNFVFSNSNGVSFGLNASTITASVAAAGGGITYSGYYPHRNQELSIGQLGNSSFHVSPLFEAPGFQHDRIVFPLFFSWATNTNSSGNLSCSVSAGIYTRNGAALSIVSSISSQFTFQYSSTVGSANFLGIRNASIPWTVTWGASNYWLGIVSRTTFGGFSLISASQAILSQNSSTLSGEFGVSVNATKQQLLGLGFFSATTNTSMPASINFSHITGSSPAARRAPYFHFASASA